KTYHSDSANMWIDIQRALRRVKLQFTGVGPTCFQLQVPSFRPPATTKTVLRQLKSHMRDMHYHAWCDLKDQGRTVGAHEGLGSRFLSRGGGLLDCEYRFAIAARMNLIATRAVLKRTHGNSNSSCRHCGRTETETLPHVLQHCPHNEASIRARHDLSLRRIAAAIAKANPSCRLLVEQPLPEFTDALLKPDIILVDDANKTAAICDLAVSFDDGNIQGSGLTGFQTRAAEKIDKYGRLSRFLGSKGYDVSSCALIFGSLGSVLPDNQAVLTSTFNLSRGTATKLQTQLSSHHIRLCRQIWRRHSSSRSVFQGRPGGPARAA
ncbi:hypothetical protein DYB32_010765, partial [Aphanomyces invadans]